MSRHLLLFEQALRFPAGQALVHHLDGQTHLFMHTLTEARRFFGAPPKFSAVIERDYLVPWPAETAERRYLDRFAKLAPA